MTKEKIDGFLSNLFTVSKKAFKSGMDASKVAIDKAGKAASKFSDEGLIKIEIKQLEFQIKRKKTELGKYVFDAFDKENRTSVASDEAEVVRIIDDIKKTRDEIEIREAKLKAMKAFEGADMAEVYEKEAETEDEEDSDSAD